MSPISKCFLQFFLDYIVSHKAFMYSQKVDNRFFGFHHN